MEVKDLSTLKIHKLSQAQYDREAAAGNLDDTAIYLTPDEGGPGTLIVTVDENDKASHTPAQIYEHVQNVGSVYLYNEEMYIPLTNSITGEAMFFYFSDDHYLVGYVVHSDSTIRMYEFRYITDDELSDKITAPSTAKVGQTIVVKSVDSNGKPTAWEAVDLLTGGSGGSNTDIMLLRTNMGYALATVGMNWSTWCDSRFNTLGIYYDDDGVYDPAGDTIADADGVPVIPSNILRADTEYDSL